MTNPVAGLYTLFRKHAALCIFAAVFVLALSGHALADGPNPPDTVPELENCTNGGFLPEQITSKIVYCVRKTVMDVTFTIFGYVVSYILDTVTVIFAVAVAFHGVKILGGEGEITPRSMKLTFKIGLIWLFFTNGIGLIYYPYLIMDELVSYVTPFPGWTPWQDIDAFVGKLLGFGGTLTVVQGVIGLVFGALFSGSVGIPMFLSGAMAMYEVMIFVLDIVYAYLSSVIVISFMIIVSPLVIPWAVFHFGERYFKRWLDTLIGAMLIPMFLFGFLSFSLSIFDTLITNTITELSDNFTNLNGDPDFAQFWRMNQPAFGWMMPSDPNYIGRVAQKVGQVACATGGPCDDRDILPPVPNVINPFTRLGFNYNLLNVFSVSYDQQKIQRIILNFVALWMYAMLLKGLIKKMPEIATAIAGSVGTLTVQNAPFKQKVRSVVQDIGIGAGAMAGGRLGGELGGALNKGLGREIGGVMGIMGGGLIGNNLAQAVNARISGMVGER